MATEKITKIGKLFLLSYRNVGATDRWVRGRAPGRGFGLPDAGVWLGLLLCGMKKIQAWFCSSTLGTTYEGFNMEN